ncbi:hypothetical protein DFJ77DRAFT_210112 [Powellomyces hirtus]|nr:hypothetical protein DFJ77DRAFT_210112 [Powellomyces hirtus]
MSWHASNRLPVRRWPSHRASHFLRASVFIVSFLAFVLPSVVDAGGRGPPPPPPRINCYGHYDARTINCHYARCGGWGQAWPWMTLNNWQDYRCTQSLGRVYAATEPVACRSCACETQTIYGAPCKGPMCNQGTRTDTIGGYNPACSITTRMTTVPCTPIPTLPANTLTQGSYTQDSFPDLNGFKTLTVFGCGGIARSPGCNWQGLCTCRPNAAGYTWPKAAQWRCISNIPPAVSLYPPEGTGNSAGALSTSWVANDPWRPSVTVKFYQYVFGGYHSVIFDSFPLNYKPGHSYRHQYRNHHRQ